MKRKMPFRRMSVAFLAIAFLIGWGAAPYEVADTRADDLVIAEPADGLAPSSLDVLAEWKILHSRDGHLDEEIVAESPINIGQLKPGAPLPPLTARTSSGEEVLLNDLWKKKPTVISLYKSAYCGHCQWQFRQLLSVHKELEALGYQVMAISHIGEIGVKRMEDRYSPPLPLFSDEGQKVGRTLGIAFGKDRPEVNFYPGRNDMGVYGSALFIVDTDGRVQYEWTYSDNKTRLGTGPVLAAAKRVIEEKTSVFTDLTKATKKPETVTHLRLNYQGLTELPVDALQLTNLVRLELVGNRLKTLPAGISAMRSLQRLDLSSNELESLPAEIGKLGNLADLQLLRNRLVQLPLEIGQLRNLERLNLMYNPIRALPPRDRQTGEAAFPATSRAQHGHTPARDREAEEPAKPLRRRQEDRQQRGGARKIRPLREPPADRESHRPKEPPAGDRQPRKSVRAAPALQRADVLCVGQQQQKLSCSHCITISHWLCAGGDVCAICTLRIIR